MPETQLQKTSATFDICSNLAKQHYENFPVGRFVSKELRPHIHAIYAFARTADDFADETEHEGNRLELLAEWRERLYLSAAGTFKDPIFEALSHTIARFKPPMSLFDDLICAFEYDVTHNRHVNFQSLLNYSQQSANPVGRLVLWLHGIRDEKLFELSDAICTALQLTNFWQDIAIDLNKDRMYVPQESMQRFSYSEAQLKSQTYNQNFQQMLRDLYTPTQALFKKGRPLCDLVSGKLSFELKLIWSGGYRILECLEKQQFDVFTHRPTLNALDKGIILWRTLRW